MPEWTQTFLALLIVAGCVAYVARVAIRTLRAKEGCGSSCGHCGPAKSSTPHTSSPPPSESKPQFVPLEFVVRSARSRK
jgi:hypothetical protein